MKAVPLLSQTASKDGEVALRIVCCAGAGVAGSQRPNSGRTPTLGQEADSGS